MDEGLATCPSLACWCCWPLSALGPRNKKPPPYLGLAQEIHRGQVLQVSPVGPEDLAPGDPPRLQRGLFLEGGRASVDLSIQPGPHLLKP